MNELTLSKKSLEIFWDTPRVFSKAEAWIDINILVQDRKEAKQMNGIIELPTGEIVFYAPKFAVRWGWHPQEVHSFFDLLQTHGLITAHTDASPHTFTINVTSNAEKVESVDDIAALFNRICITPPQVRVLTTKRKQSINARIREHGIDAVVEMVTNASKSDYLRGRSAHGWIATFDWLFKPTNFVKVLEGNYNGKPTENRGVGRANSRASEAEQAFYERASNLK